jgi:hypothetical protein
MVIKVLSWKTKEVKNINDVKSRDLIYIECNNCGKNVIKEYRVKRFNNEFISFCENCKTKQTNLRKYGVDNPVKSDIVRKKIRQTNLEKYGVDSYSKTEEYKNKCKETFIKNYGVDNPAKSDIIKEKTKQTCLDKYGVEYSGQSENNKTKNKQTCLDKYGVEYSFQSKNNKQKSKETWLKNYGVDNPAKSLEFKNKLYNTKKKNNSFNTSKPENEIYLLLKEKFSNVIKQYKEERYPFACDFYILERDLFIECQFIWSHGKKPFENTIEDLEKLNKWKNKNTKFHQKSIQTWTIRDVNKRKVVRQNNLNYLEFFYFEDAKKYIKENL